VSERNIMNGVQSLPIAGVDGCRAGWVTATVLAVASGGSLRYPLTMESISVSAHFADVLLSTNHCRLVCVDIPIGLSDGPEPRQCDGAARRVLGRRASSVFPPPARPCLAAKSYADASATQFACAGRKLSTQSFFIMDKIRQVDAVITPALQNRVREIHPEVTFYVLNGRQPARYSKKTLAGRQERIDLLSHVFPTVAQAIDKTRRAGEVEPDDVLDALAAAWTAAQATLGQAVTLPERPVRDSKGLRMEILKPISQEPLTQ
jgi:predicted RNase H-like nuclease